MQSLHIWRDVCMSHSMASHVQNNSEVLTSAFQTKQNKNLLTWCIFTCSPEHLMPTESTNTYPWGSLAELLPSKEAEPSEVPHRTYKPLLTETRLPFSCSGEKQGHILWALLLLRMHSTTTQHHWQLMCIQEYTHRNEDSRNCNGFISKGIKWF